MRWTKPPSPLHAAHHTQVNAATAAFREAVVADTLAPLSVEAKQGPNEKRARDFVDAFLAFDFISDEERRLIRLAKLALARARYASLQREINKLQSHTKKSEGHPPAVLADELFDILRGYKLDDMENQGVGITEAIRKAETEPEIILTEVRRPSFARMPRRPS